MNTSPGKIPIKTIIRGMLSPKWFFRQRAALNSPLQFPLKVKYIIDNQKGKNTSINILKPIIQILTLSDKIFFDFKGSCIRLKDCRTESSSRKFWPLKKGFGYKINMMGSSQTSYFGGGQEGKGVYAKDRNLQHQRLRGNFHIWGCPLSVIYPLIYQYSVQWLYSTGRKFTEI